MSIAHDSAAISNRFRVNGCMALKELVVSLTLVLSGMDNLYHSIPGKRKLKIHERLTFLIACCGGLAVFPCKGSAIRA